MATDNTIYLDHAAATPMDPAVFGVMQPYFTELFFNPSAQYDAARQIKHDIEAARSRIAHWMGARSSEVVFTAGGTEANNLVINGVMERYPDANIVVSAIEHDSVLRPAEQYDIRIAPVKPDGMIDLVALEQLIDDQTVLVSVHYANNEIGSIQPIKRIAEVVHTKRSERANQSTPLYLHTDACQAPAYLDIHTARLGVDFMTINASKIYGPKQTGVLFVKAGTLVRPQILGGGQEKGLRSGTENVSHIVGLAKALDLVQGRRHEEVERLKKLQQFWLQQLGALIPTAVVNGSLKHRLPNNIHITLPGQDNERLMMQLDYEGIICAVGSACSASNEEPSHVLKALGLSDEEAQASLRFTMGKDTIEEDINRTVSTLAKIMK